MGGTAPLATEDEEGSRDSETERRERGLACPVDEHGTRMEETEVGEEAEDTAALSFEFSYVKHCKADWGRGFCVATGVLAATWALKFARLHSLSCGSVVISHSVA